MVLGLALFATMATAQTNDCTSMLDGRGTRNVETGVVQNKSVDYKASIFTKQRGNGIGDTLIDGFWDFNNTTNVVYGTSGAVGANQSVKMQNPDSNYRWTTVSIPAHNLSGDAAFFMLIPDTNYLRTNASTYSGGSLAQFGYDVNWINNNLLYYNDGTGAASHVNNTMFIYFGGAVHTSSQQHDCYVQLPAITNPNTNGLYEVRITQDCMKWYDQEFVEFKVGNEWYSVEYNVVGIDASMQSWVSIKKGLTMPVEFAQQPNLQLRFRVQTSTRSNVYGFYYALDDIAIVPAVSEHWYGAQHQFVDGAYATIPYGMNIPLAWYGQVFNDGAQTITNAKATAWHISPSGVKTAITYKTADSLIPSVSALQYITLNERGFFDSIRTTGMYNLGPVWDTTSDLLPAHYTRVGLPTDQIGLNQITVTGTAGANYDTIEYDTIGYRVVGATGGGNTNLLEGFRLAHDNGIIPSRSSFRFGYYVEGENRYYTTSSETFNTAGYTVTTRISTPDEIPTDDDGNPWVIRGMEIVPRTDTTASAQVTSVIMPRVFSITFTDSSDGHIYYSRYLMGSEFTGLSDEYTYTVTANDVNPQFDQNNGVIRPGENYNAVNIQFYGQPELRPNTAYYFGYTLAENGYFGVARHLYGYYDAAGTGTRYSEDPDLGMPYYRQFTPEYHDVYVSDGGESGFCGGDYYAYYPMIRLIVGPRMEIAEHQLTVTCSETDTNYEIYNVESNMYHNACGDTLTTFEGGDATVYVWGHGDSSYAHPGVIDAIIIDGQTISVTDEDNFITDEYSITAQPEALRDADGNVLLRRDVYIVTFTNISGDHSISAVGHAYPFPLGIESEAVNVALGLQPNPATSTVSINMRGVTGMVDCSIIDMSGRVVYSRTINAESSHTVDLSNIAAGAYFVRVTNDKFSKVEKLIVR